MSKRRTTSSDPGGKPNEPARGSMLPFFQRLERLNQGELRRKRSDWTDRLPRLPARRSATSKDLGIRRHWSELLPDAVRDAYSLWLVQRRCKLNLEAIELQELDEVVETDDRERDTVRLVYDRHRERRATARYFVACAESRRLQRLARRWDVDAPRMVDKGDVNDVAMTQVRRGIREARWTFAERCAKVLIPVLSLLVALVALLSRR